MMWYRFAQELQEELEKDNSANDRQILDMTGGVKSRKTPEKTTELPPINEPSVTYETPEFDEEQVIDNPIVDIDKTQNEEPSNDTFTDYTPPSSNEEEAINQIQDKYRADDLNMILDKVGVQLPMHDSCRCRIQFRPDSFDSDLLIPRWEISPDSCADCTLAQQKFNQYVEETGIRVRLPGSAVDERDAVENTQI